MYTQCALTLRVEVSIFDLESPNRSFAQRGFFSICYPPEVSSMKYCHLGIFRKEYFRLLTK